MNTPRAIVERFEPAFRAADHITIDELCHPDFTDHNAGPGQPTTLEAFKQKVTAFAQAIPDLTETMHDIVAHDDTVATRWTITGTLQHELMGIPGQGQPIAVDGMNFYRVRDGRITDLWTQYDAPTLMNQLTNPAPKD